MKKTILILVALIVASCGQSKEETLIANYVQTLGNSKIDANFKMKNLEKLEDITAEDSLKILKFHFKQKKEDKIHQFQKEIIYSKERLDKYTKDLAETNPNHKSLVELYETYIYEAKMDIERNEKNIQLYEGDCKGTFLEPILASILKYEELGDKIIYSKYKASYSINNPLLNNIKQEFQKEFYINSEKNKVIKAAK